MLSRLHASAINQLVLLCHEVFALIVKIGYEGKSAQEVKSEKNAQRCDGVRHVALCALDYREGCNPREWQVSAIR
jgi:hypothetical protein